MQVKIFTSPAYNSPNQLEKLINDFIVGDGPEGHVKIIEKQVLMSTPAVSVSAGPSMGREKWQDSTIVFIFWYEFDWTEDDSKNRSRT